MRKVGSRKPNPFKWVRLRVFLVGSFLGVCLVVVVGRAFQLQVLESDWLQSKAEGQYQKAFEDIPNRGNIYDRNNARLATSLDVSSVCAYPREIGSPAETAAVLGKALQLDRTHLLDKLSSRAHFVWVKRHADPEEVSALKALGLEGIGFRTESRRFYPTKTVAAQVIGFCGTDGTGLSGLEFYYDDVLKGQQGRGTTLRDALGRSFAKPACASEGKTGLNLVLTIDGNIQCIAEEALSEGVRAYSAKSGLALVMAPKTGEILAMAHYPRFNPNAYNDYPGWSWRNRVVTDFFEPGSTFKIFLMAAALESGLCTPRSEFYCENGAYRVGRNVVHDVHPHDTLSLRDILKYSSNIGAAKVGETIGSHYLYDTLRAFGFGNRFSIGAPGETPGRLLPVGQWTSIDARAICFGQGVAVSALQLGSAVSAIANDGLLMQPYVVHEITNSQGRVVKAFEPELVRQVISTESARLLKHMMQRTVEKGGTGVRAALRGHTVAGKTGTAQKVDSGGCGYAEDKFMASFVGFAPVEQPEIVTLVVIDEPKKIHYGGVVAAPVFKEIVEKTLRYLKIPPELSIPELTDHSPNNAERSSNGKKEEALRIS